MKMTRKPNLKPCPWCKYPARFWHEEYSPTNSAPDHNFYGVCCNPTENNKNCPVKPSTIPFNSMIEAENAWNSMNKNNGG